MGDGFIVDEPLFATAEGYIGTAITDMGSTYELLDTVGLDCPNGIKCKETILYSCAVIQNAFNYILSFREVMATTRANLATLDESFAAAQKKEEKGLWSSFFENCGADFKRGFHSLLQGEGFDNLLDAFSRTGSTLFVLGTSSLNRTVNTISQPALIVANSFAYAYNKFKGSDKALDHVMNIKDISRGNYDQNYLDAIYNTEYGRKINRNSYIKYNSSNITKYEKTSLTKLNESILSKLYNYNHSTANKSLNTSAKSMKNFDTIFNEHYGGAQGDPIKIFNQYGSERRMLNDTSINGQKAQMLYGKIKEYYPDATFDDVKKIAQAYNESGCTYMAIADAFTLHASSQENGEAIFKKVVGKDLYSTDGQTKSANVEVLALDLFLYKSKMNNRSIDDIIEDKNYDNSGNAIYAQEKYLQNYFKEKNVKVYNTVTDIRTDEETHHQMTYDITSFEKNHDDAIYVLSGSNFNMVSKETGNGNNSGDGALEQASTSGNNRRYLHNVGGHSMFITGYNDDSIEVSSWAGKYDVPITSTFTNTPKNGITPELYVVGYDFDYSGVLK